MGIFTLGNLICALAPNYTVMMAARIITSLCHGAFFGIGSVVATNLVPKNKQAYAIALMFTGLTVANIMGVPAGTWLGQAFGWRSTFWAITMIGPIAMTALAFLVPAHVTQSKINIADECRTVFTRPVLLGLLTTTLGCAGLFETLTYIAPILTQQSGIAETMISPMMFLFGLGLIVGNIWGARIADKYLQRALYITLGGLSVCLILYSVFSGSAWAMTGLTFLFGLVGFAVVPPLQMNVLSRASAAPTLASALNIAAFNLGNATGAWTGGLVVDSEIGLAYVPIIGALLALAGMGLTWVNRPISLNIETA